MYYNINEENKLNYVYNFKNSLNCIVNEEVNKICIPIDEFQQLCQVALKNYIFEFVTARNVLITCLIINKNNGKKVANSIISEP